MGVSLHSGAELGIYLDSCCVLRYKCPPSRATACKPTDSSTVGNGDKNSPSRSPAVMERVATLIVPHSPGTQTMFQFRTENLTTVTSEVFMLHRYGSPALQVVMWGCYFCCTCKCPGLYTLSPVTGCALPRCLLPRAAVTKYHRRGGFKRGKPFSVGCGLRSLRTRCQQDRAPMKAPGKSLPCRFPLLVAPAVLVIPRLVLQSPCLSSRVTPAGNTAQSSESV